MSREIDSVPVDVNGGITLQSDNYPNPNSPVSLEQEQGEIRTTTNTTQFTVSSGSNHNEVRILESDWDEICRKAKAINFKKRLDWTSLMWGVTIPVFIETISEKGTENGPNYLALAICFLLIIVTTSKLFQKIWRVVTKWLEAVMSRIYAWIDNKTGVVQLIDDGSDDENRVHHQDLLNTIERISLQRKKNKKCK